MSTIMALLCAANAGLAVKAAFDKQSIACSFSVAAFVITGSAFLEMLK